MNAIKAYFKRSKEALTTKTAKVGGYSFAVTLIVAAILIAVNIAVSLLPTTWTSFDISSAQLYSVTSSTKVVVQNLEKDVTIYWISQADEEDAVIEKLLDVYESLSSRLSVVKKNPDVYPTFAAQYTDATVYNNSLIVECGDKYRYIPYADIYTADTSSYYTTGSVAYSFDGEGAITTAIDYVISEDLPQLYLLTGHGEQELSDSFQSALQKQNIETVSFSLLNIDEMPEDADAVMINSPTSDISEEEWDMLSDYLDNGGKLIVFSGPQEEERLENLEELLDKYNISVNDGIVIEGNRNNYAFAAPYVLLPELGDSDITAELSQSKSYVITPLCSGLSVYSSPTGVTVTTLLETSSEAFSKLAGYSLDTYEMEEDDIQGPFALAVAVEDSASEGELIWIASDCMLDDMYNSYSAGANTDFVMNAVSALIGESDAISIRSKSLDYSYLTISTSQASLIKWILIGIVPMMFIVMGVEDMLERRRKG